MLRNRDEVSIEDRWNVEDLYSTFECWEQEFKEVSNEGQSPRWPGIFKYQGKLSESPETLKKALEEIFTLSRKLEKLYTYAHLKHDEETSDDQGRSAYMRSIGALHQLTQDLSWFEPELLEMPENLWQKTLDDPALKPYRFHLERIYRLKPHTLSKDSEKLLAMAGKALTSPQRAFKALNDADFVFGSVKDKDGKEHHVTHAEYSVMMRSKDRTLRKNAFETYHSKFRKYENTLCELLSGQIESQVFNARARNFESSLEAALFPNNIPPRVYRTLIDVVNQRLPSLHRYFKIRKELLGVDELHMYDMYVPLTPNVDMKMPYDQACDEIIDSVESLGSEYQKTLKQGMTVDRWVDKFENKSKRSGGYSSGCYDSMPYILMNYKGIIRDVFTLAHEAGHSMHSFLSRKNQPYHYGDYPIFVAEVASTFNEELLTKHLLKKDPSNEEKAFLINQKLEDIRGTLFRQTMFAEFELKIHEMVENGIPLTPKLLRESYHALNKKYFGNEVVIDEAIDIEWARIPHFYYNFYVYQYATGISAALTLSDKIEKGGDTDKEAYLSFLKGGSSKFPMELLTIAGADMSKPEPVMTAIDRFDRMLDELEELIQEPAKS